MLALALPDWESLAIRRRRYFCAAAAVVRTSTAFGCNAWCPRQVRVTGYFPILP